MNTGLTVLARLNGALLDTDAEELLNWLQPLCCAAPRVVLDLRQVDEIGSSGIGVLLLVRDTLEAEQGELHLMVSPGSHVQRRLARLHVEEQFRLYEGTCDELLRLLETGKAPIGSC